MIKRILPVFALCLALLGCTIEYAPPVRPGYRPVSGDGLTVHFIDVGQADCALVECDGEYMLIDGGNAEDGQLVVSYLLQQGVEQLNTVICTHPHEDHAGGLPAVLAVFPVEAIFSSTTTYASDIYDDFLRYADQQKVTVQIPSPGDTFLLGDGASAATVTVLGPVKAYAETNDTSIVVRIDYGETSFLFTGDMETAAETDMLEYWASTPGRADVDVLKVGHHGSETSTGYRLLYETSPEYAVISVGEGNTYGHPHEKPLSRLLHAGCTIFRTDSLGSITAYSDGQEITFTWENQRAKPDNLTQSEDAYVGNQKSHIFHTSDCENLPGSPNQVFLGTYLDFLAAGYIPCGNCLE